jgi:hypothetical protein
VRSRSCPTRRARRRSPSRGRRRTAGAAESMRCDGLSATPVRRSTHARSHRCRGLPHRGVLRLGEERAPRALLFRDREFRDWVPVEEESTATIAHCAPC